MGLILLVVLVVLLLGAFPTGGYGYPRLGYGLPGILIIVILILLLTGHL